MDATEPISTGDQPTREINETARAFDQVAAVYERTRPDYPQAALDAVISRLGVGPERHIVDLGAGTGKLTVPLLRAGANVTAVEPVGGMRDQLERSVPGDLAERLTVVDASAESLPLADGSVDGATAGQAYHWFDAIPALEQIHRVLAPGCWFAVLHNRRDLLSPPQAALEDLMRPHRGQTPSWVDTSWSDSLDAPVGFNPAELLTFPNHQVVDAEGFVGRVASVSFVAKMPAAMNRQILETAGTLFSMLERDGVVELQYTTELRLLQRTET